MNLLITLCLFSVLSAVPAAFSEPASRAKKVADGDITGLLSPEGFQIGRPDAVAVGNRLYLAFNDIKTKKFRLAILDNEGGLDLRGGVMALFSGYNAGGIDIRVASQNGKFWYAFEDFKKDLRPCGDRFVNIAVYETPDKEPAVRTNISSGCGTSKDAASTDPKEVPENPEAADDPSPLFFNGKFHVLTRAWSGWIKKYKNNSIHHIRVFDASLKKTGDFILDLSELSEGRTLSQNALAEIRGRVYLIGGFYLGAREASDIYAVPLSTDLGSPAGEKIPLLTGKEYDFKVTKAVFRDPLLYINFQRRDGGKVGNFLASFDANDGFSKLAELEIASAASGAITANHTSFDILGEKIFFSTPVKRAAFL
ncbi:MAG: hypothetical protein COT17_04085 [Elusimicrobia bacterium CG08_land_8_20_14_0_20_51_18]|nr:MAG: hypothetical protein COT17_04085 [Elusimicrobia bacterium CG08_land_8_20_14_0_20_51_18]